MADILRSVRQAMYTRLSDDNIGFNAKYEAIQSDYGVPDVEIDWSDGSANFGWGLVPPNLVESTSPFQYPLLMISATIAKQDGPQQRIKFKQFSGRVGCQVQITVSWDESGITDFETWPDAIVHAGFDSINDPSLPNNWGPGLVYAGDLDVALGPITAAGRHWRRQVLFSSVFTLIA